MKPQSVFAQLIILVTLTFGACHKATDIVSFLDTTPKIINIQPFGDINATQIAYICQQLSAIYDSVQLLKSIPLPQTSYYPARNRYRADSLITFLKNQTANGHITIGLTNKDISTTKGKFKDWGIMGLGFCPGKACVVSTFRLSKKETLDQLYKISVHELGHTHGLPHCATKTCFMRDAEGKNPLKEETNFCPKCRLFLQTKGCTLR